MTTAPKLIRLDVDENTIDNHKEQKLEKHNKINIELIDKLLENKETHKNDDKNFLNNKFLLNNSNKTDNIDSKKIRLIHDEKENEKYFNSPAFKEEYKNTEQDRSENHNLLSNSKNPPNKGIQKMDDPNDIISKDNLFSSTFDRNSEYNRSNLKINKLEDKPSGRFEGNELLNFDSVRAFKENYPTELIQENKNQKPNFLKTHLSSFSRLLLDHLLTEIAEKKRNEAALNNIKIMERRNSETDLQKIKNEEKKMESTKFLQADIKREMHLFFEPFNQIKNWKTKKQEKVIDLDIISIINNYNSANFETAISLIRQMYEKILRNEKMIPRMRKPVILKLISNIYTEKLKNYKNKQFPPFVEMVYCYFLNTYGMKKIADSKFIHVN